MWISPCTPTGTGLPPRSRMEIEVLAIGLPIGIAVASSGSRRGIGWQQAKVVASVGPYPLISAVSGSRSKAPPDVSDRKRLAPDQELTDPREDFGRFIDHGIEQGGGQPNGVDLVTSQQIAKIAQSGESARSENATAAVRPSAPQISKVDASKAAGAIWRIVRPPLELSVIHVKKETDDPTVWDSNPFGYSCRAGGIHDVTEVIRVDDARRIDVVFEIAWELPVVDADDLSRRFRQQRQKGLFGQQNAGACVIAK